MHPAFDSPRELVDRARDHTNELQTRIVEFFQTKRHAPVVEIDSDTGEEVHKFRLTAQIPGKFNAITKDAISNLRDALDHSVYASCVAPGQEAKFTKFPFADTAREFEGALWSLKEVSPAIWDVLERFRPYQGGDDLLWALNKLRNTKTHRVLVPIGAIADGTGVKSFGGHVVGPIRFSCAWDPAKNEIEYVRVGRGSQLKYEIEVAFDVAIGDVPIIGGQPVLRVLYSLTNKVESVLMAIEAETERLLRMP